MTKELKRIDGTWLKSAREKLEQITGETTSSETLRYSVLFAHNSHEERSEAYNRFVLSVGSRKYFIRWGFNSVHTTPTLRVYRYSGADLICLRSTLYPHYTQRDTYYAPMPLLEVVTPIIRDLIEGGDIPCTLDALLSAGLAPAELVHLQRTKEGIERKIQEKLQALINN